MPKKPASHPDCQLPRGPDGKIPKLTSLPKSMEGCVFAVHGNSTARYPKKKGQRARPALSIHPSVTGGTILNVHEPLLFEDAKLVVNQSAAKSSVKGKKKQAVKWPHTKRCSIEEEKELAQGDKPTKCNTAKGEECSKTGYCVSERRKKTPMGYVVGAVYPDPGVDLGPAAISVSLYAGDFRDGKWIDAKFIDVRCPEKDKSLCPAVTSAKRVRFIPNWTDSGAPQPFSTQVLAGRPKSRRMASRRRSR